MGYKHMSHIYENPDLKFSEIKNLFIAASQGELNGTEKTDGQNMFVSYSIVDREARASRNDSNLTGLYREKDPEDPTKTKIIRKHAAGGVNAKQWAENWSTHPSRTVEQAFVEAFEIFEMSVQSLPPEKLEKIFGDGERHLIFYNCEVQDPRNMNTIRYDKKTLTIHRVGHLYIDLSDGRARDMDTTTYESELANALVHMQTMLQNREFNIEINAIRQLKAISDKEPLKIALKKIEELLDQAGISDNQTVGEYTKARLKSMIRPHIRLPEDKENRLIGKIIGEKGLKINNIKKDLPPEQKTIIDKIYADKRFMLKNAIQGLEYLIHDFAVEMLKGFESAFVLDQGEEIERQRSMVSAKRKEIEAAKDEDKLSVLMRNFEKIKNIENISTAAEGFVFDYNNHTYKFTGNFAPINQILGIGKYDRGPAKKDIVSEEEDLENMPKQMADIAVVPGAFKPPHVGHYAMVEHYLKKAEKVAIIISNPKIQNSSRRLGTGTEVTADIARNIWRIFLKGNPNVFFKDTAASSPVTAAIEYIKLDEASGGAPENSKVILGCGDKGSDIQRFKDISKYKRDDLQVEVSACPMEARHTDEYLNILVENEEIYENLPSLLSEEKEIIDFHASDMRYLAGHVAKDNKIAEELFKDFLPDPHDYSKVLQELGIQVSDIDDHEDTEEKKSLTLESLFSLVEGIIAEKNILNEMSSMQGGHVSGAMTSHDPGKREEDTEFTSLIREDEDDDELIEKILQAFLDGK
jgi:hypothetical protein